MNYTIRPTTEEDLPVLADILNYYIVNTTVSFYKNTLSVGEMREKVLFDQPQYKTFVLKEHAKIIGYCAVSLWKKQEAYRNTAEINIYLQQDHTGKGMGSVLLLHAEQFAKENDIHTLIAGLCSENLPSRKLFEKNGYKLCASFENVGVKFGRELSVIYLQKFL